jgi:Asp-tRNA(Asn)/Glu-tRNA(Gln) amidotransferase A subunit family amidase
MNRNHLPRKFPANSAWRRAVWEGKPIGLQIVGNHNADFNVLQLVYAFEQATGFGLQRPVICI